MRAAYNPLILPYYIGDEPLYCLLKRSDMAIWQFVAGGGEDDEIPQLTAARELAEETGLTEIDKIRLQPLATSGTVPSNVFKVLENAWKEGFYVIPVHTFAYEMTQTSLMLSEEHSEYRWVTYEEAVALLHYDIDKTALWELKMRLKNAANIPSSIK